MAKLRPRKLMKQAIEVMRQTIALLDRLDDEKARLRYVF